MKKHNTITIYISLEEKTEWQNYSDSLFYCDLSDFITQSVRLRIKEVERQKTKRKSPKPSVVYDIPNGDICGIYALVDENGKMYIGSSVNIKKRVKQHNYFMSQIKAENKTNGLVSASLGQAVLDGHIFRVQILEEVSSPKNLWERELFYIKKEGIENLYNAIEARRKKYTSPPLKKQLKHVRGLRGN